MTTTIALAAFDAMIAEAAAAAKKDRFATAIRQSAYSFRKQAGHTPGTAKMAAKRAIQYAKSKMQGL